MNQIRPARRRAWTTALAALGLVVAAACGGSDDDESADDATTTVDVEVDDTTTSSTEATTTTLSEADRFRTIAVDLWTARNDLYQNPPADPESALAEIFHPQCSCYQDELDALNDVISQGGRVSGPPSMPLGIRFDPTSSSSDSAALVMAIDASPRQLLANDGTVIRELAGDDPVAVTLSIGRLQGEWRIDAAVVLDVDDSYVAELITEGLP